jgi:hypothetical protein
MSPARFVVSHGRPFTSRPHNDFWLPIPEEATPERPDNSPVVVRQTQETRLEGFEAFWQYCQRWERSHALARISPCRPSRASAAPLCHLRGSHATKVPPWAPSGRRRRNRGQTLGDCIGDDSDGAADTFYQGVGTSAYPGDATENAIQATITTAGYR